MGSQGYRKLLAVPLVAILQLSAIAAVAGEVSTAELLSLNLEEAVIVEGPVYQTDFPQVVELHPAPAVGLTELRLLVQSDAYVMSQDASDPASTQEKKGVGRWLKKHWWVPVLAAVVLGVVLLEPNDDDKGQDDDD